MSTKEQILDFLAGQGPSRVEDIRKAVRPAIGRQACWKAL